MGLREIKKELQNFDKAQLIELILELYNKDKKTKEYMAFFMNPNEEALLEKYKERVRKPFWASRPHRVKIGSAKTALAEFKKLGVTSNALVQLYFHFVEAGIERTLTDSYMRPPVYNALASVYTSAVALIDKEGLHKDFKVQAQNILKDAYKCDYYFHTVMADSYVVNFHEEAPSPSLN